MSEIKLSQEDITNIMENKIKLLIDNQNIQSLGFEYDLMYAEKEECFVVHIIVYDRTKSKDDNEIINITPKTQLFIE